MVYLAEKSGNEVVYPKDPKARAVVNQRLYFDMGTLYQSFAGRLRLSLQFSQLLTNLHPLRLLLPATLRQAARWPREVQEDGSCLRVLEHLLGEIEVRCRRNLDPCRHLTHRNRLVLRGRQIRLQQVRQRHPLVQLDQDHCSRMANQRSWLPGLQEILPLSFACWYFLSENRIFPNPNYFCSQHF